jgi:hypothetical protein
MARYFSVSTSEDNSPYSKADEAAQNIWALTLLALNNGEADCISDETVRRIMTAAIKLYAAKADGGMRTFRAIEGRYDEVVTPTEALTATTEILRALGLGPVEFGLWSRRRPEDPVAGDRNQR